MRSAPIRLPREAAAPITIASYRICCNSGRPARSCSHRIAAANSGGCDRPNWKQHPEAYDAARREATRPTNAVPIARSLQPALHYTRASVGSSSLLSSPILSGRLEPKPEPEPEVTRAQRASRQHFRRRCALFSEQPSRPTLAALPHRLLMQHCTLLHCGLESSRVDSSRWSRTAEFCTVSFLSVFITHNTMFFLIN